MTFHKTKAFAVEYDDDANKHTVRAWRENGEGLTVAHFDTFEEAWDTCEFLRSVFSDGQHSASQGMLKFLAPTG